VPRSLALVVCGAPLTSRTADIVQALAEDDWDVTVIGTPSADAWLDVDAVARVAGRPVRQDFRRPSASKSGSDPDVLLVCPATFNTINKAASGVSDTYALGLLCEFMGTGHPTLAVPMVNNKLWGHPAWQASLDVLSSAGVVLLDVQTGDRGTSPVQSGTGDEVVRSFDPRWLTRVLKTLI
jgi:phosphopantothenoylcysteine synthetase/decarboxylase